MIASVAIAATLLSAVLPSVFGDPVVVTSYVGLVETVGADNEYDTGMRFTRYYCCYITHASEETLE